VTLLAELVIQNARLVLPEGIVEGGLAIDGGRITEISKAKLPSGEREINAGGKLVIPGVIDAHAHIYDPNYTHREDFQTGTTAAAVGGVTSVIVAPLDSPVLTPEEMQKVIDVGRKQSIIDFALHAGNMTADGIKNIASLASRGVKSFKAFTCVPYQMSDGALEAMMAAVKNVDGVAFVHAEDDKTIEKNTQRLMREEHRNPLAYAESRPNEAEEKAVKRVIELAQTAECNLHLAHITTRQGTELAGKAKAKRVNVTAETCPHYLIFAKGAMVLHGPYLKVNPALKNVDDVAALWAGLAKGTIDIVTTDHAPGTKEEKEIGWNDIWAAQTGIPGVETLLPLMFTEGVAKGRLSIERLVDVLCTKPARIFGLYPQKGVIREGSDADLVIIDTEKVRTIKAEKLHYKVGWTPYEGFEVKGVPTMTISRGEVIVEERHIAAKPGRGQYLAR